MKSFNRDPRIFCMVLSTHIRSLGVYHIEADTVIFYDSDLNPVMDGKTQSWCDLIGRAKDIHVYRYSVCSIKYHVLLLKCVSTRFGIADVLSCAQVHVSHVSCLKVPNKMKKYIS